MNNCKYCKADCALRGKDNLKECKGHIPMTNADRIRAMSDEELVSILMGVPDYPCDVKIPAGECDERCENCIMDWLQQPAEGERL